MFSPNKDGGGCLGRMTSCRLHPWQRLSVKMSSEPIVFILQEDDIYTNTIVIQRHRTVVTADDVAYKVQCAFDTSVKTVLNSDVNLK